ncbi:bifunctional serine/threonine-protein kinase/universal stress protein [Oryzibacter oryziterrae]|uniref:bifunctional serine/threonine-protein kinase/universal stress protein n=1 Tax=Oryzibacter oryziterrae TaxID=2766474 RepID=UPI001F1ECA8E|nr:bifunctional serine/threonine-protein kinase/universal stress protein [Oryzibacter oryziterrae]
MGPMSLLPGTVLDGFVLEEKIAVGGMGSIWRANHPDWPFPLVLKSPFLGAGADVSTIVGYETEEMILKRVEGKHVPRFVAAGDLRIRPYLVMEFVEGTVLQSMLEDTAKPYAEVVKVGIQVAAALENLHRQGVIHLDLKPGNIILAKRGAVLIDFGLARHERLPDLLGEESDIPMGSAATIAPEQCVGERSRPESDIYALGCILYRMATGDYPHGEPTSVAGQKRRLYSLPQPPRAINAKIPKWLQEIILRCLEIDPDQRYRSAGQLLFDLNHPDQVILTDRAEREGKGGLFRRLGAWMLGRSVKQRPLTRMVPTRRVSAAPLVVVAVDLARGADPLAQEVRLHLRRVLSMEEGARLACLTVLKTKLHGNAPTHDSHGRTMYLSRLVALKDWAQPLELPDDRVSYHVLEALDPASALLDYIRLNQVDHVVMGARGVGALRRHLGSVSSAVVAEAPCSVTVVRLKGAGGAEEGA